MISLGPVQDAIKKATPPIPDAPYLNQALVLAQDGKMLQNPLDGPIGQLKNLGIGETAASLTLKATEATKMADALSAKASVMNTQAEGLHAAADAMGDYGGNLRAQATAISNVASEHLAKATDLSAASEVCSVAAEKYANIGDQKAAIDLVSKQMFTGTMSIKAPMPDALLSISGLPAADISKLKDFNIPSATHVLSSASAEQAINSNLGIQPDNPCAPVQKSIETNMAAARAMNSSVADMASNNTLSTLQSGLSSLRSGLGSIDLAISGAASGLGSLISGIGRDTDAAFSKISKSITDMGKSLISSINTVRASDEKAMNIATAAMAKNMVANNPCMKDVLSPGKNVIVFNTAFVLSNSEGDADSAEWRDAILDDSAIVYETTLSSRGFETWEHSHEATAINDNRAELSVSITYTIDAGKYQDIFMSLPTTNTFFVKMLVTNAITGMKMWFKLYTNFTGLDTDNPTPKVLTDMSKSANIVSGPITWSATKKTGLLTPEMQTMTEPTVEKEPDIAPSTEPYVIKTESEIVKDVAAAEKASAPPTVVETPTIVKKPAPIIDAIVPNEDDFVFKQDLEMTRVRVNTGDEWSKVASVARDRSGIGSVYVDVHQTPSGCKVKYTYMLAAYNITKIIKKMKLLPANKSIFYQSSIVMFYDAANKNIMNTTIYFNVSLVPETNQISFTCTQTAGLESTPFTWDETNFVDAEL